MLSILVPIYNYDVTKLIHNLHQQALNLGITFEILAYEDASDKFLAKNKKIQDLSFTNYQILTQNIGRSKIRNLLAQRAKYNWLLFLDADVLPVSSTFLQKYLTAINPKTDLIAGGINYSTKKPTDSAQYLRWIYGHKRETKTASLRNQNPYSNFSSANFLIKKNIFSEIYFNETIEQYGHEDTLFAYNFKTQKGRILHINNPILHLGLENNTIFLNKSLLSVKSALFLKNQKLIPSSYIKLLTYYEKLENLSLALYLIYLLGNVSEPLIKKNLLGKKPVLKALDFYKLYYLIKLEQNA